MLEGAELLYKLYWHRKVLMRRYKRIKGFSKPKVKRVRERTSKMTSFRMSEINLIPRMDFVLVFSFVVVLGLFWFKINQRQEERKQRMQELHRQHEMIDKQIQDWRKRNGYK